MPQAPAAHCGLTVIEQAQQCRPVVGTQRCGDFKIAARGWVEHDVIGICLAFQCRNVRQAAALGRARVVEQRCRGGQQFGCIVDTEGFERGHLQCLAQAFGAARRVEVPVGTGLRYRAGLSQRRAKCVRPGVWHESLGRRNPSELGGERRARHRCRAQFARSQNQPGESEVPAPLQRSGDCKQRCVSTVLQQTGVCQRTGRHDAYDLPLDRSLAAGHLADLFADRHFSPSLTSRDGVLLDKRPALRHHPDRRPRRSAARNQRDVEKPRGARRYVLVEQLTSRPSSKHQHVRMLHLDVDAAASSACGGLAPLGWS